MKSRNNVFRPGIDRHYLHTAALVGEQLRYAVSYPVGPRAMKLCLDRLSEDWQAHHGHPILALESFVDGQLFRGTLYKASNWTMLGPTAGFGRVAEDFYVPHQRPKQLWVRALHPQAREWLSAPELPAPLEVEAITLAWQDQVLGPNPDPLGVIDGKTLKHSGGHLAGAISLPSHRCLGVEPVADKRNEIPATQKLIERAPILPGQMVSLDAMHPQHKTVAQILFDKGADYLLPIKGNQDALLRTAQQLLPESVPPSGRENRRQSQPAGTALAGDPSD